jgi:antirestriction protein ArdC
MSLAWHSATPLARQFLRFNLLATYWEAVRLGGHVMAGEQSTPIVFWKWLSREVEKDDGTIAEHQFPMLC